MSHHSALAMYGQIDQQIIVVQRFVSNQARSQDLEKGGYFERMRKVQTSLTRIFIVLESDSHGLSKN